MRDRGFRFRLERVRWLRQQAERGAQEALAASMRSRSEGERSVREIDATIERTRESERAVAGAAGERPLRSGEELLAVELYMERLAGSRAVAARELAQREREVEARRLGLVAAARERQALDRLRGRRLEQHRLEAARIEGAELDELALAAHRRRRAA